VSGFQHDIAGGGGNLIVTSVQSPAYSPGSAGWQIRKDGSAEFNNLSIRGTFNGTDFILNSSGAFFYSPSEGAGNLVASIAPAAGLDQFNNNYLAGSASYAATFATALNAGFVAFYSGSLSGGWTALSSVSGDTSGNLQVNAGGQLQLIGSSGVTINGSNQTSTATGNPATSGPNGGVFAGHTHFFAGHTHTV
jgi:hypothetical protein